MPGPAVLPIAYPPNTDYTRQSIEVPGTKKPGQTGHYRNGAFPFLTLDSPDAFQNVVELFDSGRQRVPDGGFPMLGKRPVLSTNPLTLADHYEWISWDEVDTRRKTIGSALTKLFDDGVVGGGPLKTVGIYSGNCPEWQLVDLALQAYHLVLVSLYDTLGKDTVEYIINHTEMTVLFAAPQHIANVLKLASKIPTLKCIVSMSPLPTDSKTILAAWGEQLGIKVLDLLELEAIGKAHSKPITYPNADTISTICYTSGTTGNPKGVVMTHGVLANAIHAQLYGLNLTEIPKAVCFLPLAHVYGRMCELTAIARGGSLGYWSGDPLRLLEDIQILKPNMFPAVPRVLNRIVQAGMAASTLPGLKGALFRRALETKLANLRTTGSVTHPLWDRLIFKKVQAVLGGEVKMISSGSAPMSASAIDFLKVALSCEIIEGHYGSTENIGTATRAFWSDKSGAGFVGAPHTNIEAKLVDVPSMGYTSEDKPYPRGEICIRGDGCFREYYKDPENTKAAIDADGWQHSGDVGLIDEFGRFKIIDRVKNIMKLSQGEYVALERVESLYSACPVVAQLYVHGDSLQSYLLGVIIPDPVQLAAIASKVWGKPVSDKDTAALDKAIQDPKVYDAILQALNRQAREAGLQGFETIKRLHISNELLTVENGCLTPTLKLKRKETYNRFKKELDALYALGEPTLSKTAKL